VERVVFNALANHAALPPNVCAFGDSFVIVFGEADPPARSGDRIGLARFTNGSYFISKEIPDESSRRYQL
jgi:hypothetical protein